MLFEILTYFLDQNQFIMSTEKEKSKVHKLSLKGEISFYTTDSKILTINRIFQAYCGIRRFFMNAVFDNLIDCSRSLNIPSILSCNSSPIPQSV